MSPSVGLPICACIFIYAVAPHGSYALQWSQSDPLKEMIVMSQCKLRMGTKVVMEYKGSHDN